MPPDLRQRYRQEMTIVLQYQFWDLEVDEERFGVTLSFGGRQHHLSVPFAAVKVFADPGVEFGLQFTLADAEADAEAPETSPTEVKPVPLGERGDGDDQPGDDDQSDDPAAPRSGADIVTLDRFRKR